MVVTQSLGKALLLIPSVLSTPETFSKNLIKVLKNQLTKYIDQNLYPIIKIFSKT